MENIIALVAATIVLILIPGPNVALIVANSLRHGMRIGIITSLGTTVGIALQLLIVVLGMAALIESIADALTWIKWIGVIYLLAVGLRTWSKPAPDLSDIKAQARTRAFLRGVVLAVIKACAWLGRVGHLHNRISGGFLVGAGVGLALSRRSL